MKDKYAILVTGDRNWSDDGVVAEVLEQYPPGTIVIHGDAHGADSWAGTLARRQGKVEVRVPYIRSLGRSGGPARNTYMVQLLRGLNAIGYVCEVHAFHDDLESSRGTKHCVSAAQKAGFKVEMHTTKNGR
jgi:hypothetical protein